MALGFGPTFGTDTGDYIGMATDCPRPTASSRHIWMYKHGTGGSGEGYTWARYVTGVYSTWFRFGSGNLLIQVTFNGGYGLWSVAPPTSDVWTSVIVTHDASSLSNLPAVYYDNVAQTVTTQQAPAGTYDNTQNADDNFLGNNYSLVKAWDGMLAEFAEWDRILTSGERASLAAGNYPNTISSGLYSYIPGLSNATDTIRGASSVTGVKIQTPHPIPFGGGPVTVTLDALVLDWIGGDLTIDEGSGAGGTRARGLTTLKAG